MFIRPEYRRQGAFTYLYEKVRSMAVEDILSEAICGPGQQESPEMLQETGNGRVPLSDVRGKDMKDLQAFMPLYCSAICGSFL